MTPKEKAKELIESFYKCMPFRDVKLTSCDETPELIIQMEKLSAKQCALIAVDEAIEFELRIVKEVECLSIKAEMRFKCEALFWEEVKQEIEKI